MRFRRKSDPEVAALEETTGSPGSPDAPKAPDAPDAPVTGGTPVDAEDVADPSTWVDLGSLLVAPHEGRELRLQVDEQTHAVQAVMLVGADGAAELRPFAAPRNGQLWDEVRPQIAADMARRGGTATEQQGPFGTELLCRQTVQDEQGRAGQQPSRILGINGSRWLLLITLIGAPAADTGDQGAAARWQDFSGIAVRRGEAAMPPGDPLPLVLPDDSRRSGPL